MKNFSSVWLFIFNSFVKPSFIVSCTVAITIFFIHAVTHYGFGTVTIPKWYTNKSVEYLYEPTPFREFQYYWIKEGCKLSFICGVISFVITNFVILFKKNFDKISKYFTKKST